MENYENDNFEGDNPIQNFEDLLENSNMLENKDKKLLFNKENEDKYNIFHLYKWASIMF